MVCQGGRRSIPVDILLVKVNSESPLIGFHGVHGPSISLHMKVMEVVVGLKLPKPIKSIIMCQRMKTTARSGDMSKRNLRNRMIIGEIVAQKKVAEVKNDRNLLERWVMRSATIILTRTYIASCFSRSVKALL